jgi:hypothetical protein
MQNGINLQKMALALDTWLCAKKSNLGKNPKNFKKSEKIKKLYFSDFVGEYQFISRGQLKSFGCGRLGWPCFFKLQ